MATSLSQATSDVCVVIRMFNEAEALPLVLQEVRSTFLQVVCVDDGSSDASFEIARACGALVVRHPRNLGGGAALATGLKFALRQTDASYFVTFDADGQHRVQDALRLVQQARCTGADIVLGSRFLESNSTVPTMRKLVLKAGILFTRLMNGMSVTDTHNGLRLFSRRATEQIRLTQHGMAYASELLDEIHRCGFRYTECPVTIHYTDYSRRKGQKNLNAVNIIFDTLVSKARPAA